MNKKDRIRKIKEFEDFEELFNIEKKVENKTETFEELLKEYEKDRNVQSILESKLKDNEREKLSVKEKIANYPSPQDTLDLHGLNSKESENETMKFINTSRKKNYKTVRIITGKGIHSSGLPVLRDKLENIAIKLKKARIILDWKWEKKQKEKSGAIIMFLN